MLSLMRQNTLDEFGKTARLGGHVVLNSGFNNILAVYSLIILSRFWQLFEIGCDQKNYLLLCVHVCTPQLFINLK